MNTNEDYAPLILPRPVWVNDMDVSYCSSCNNAFGPLKRRHHCRNCGNIFCHECSSRKVPLPQLGDGTKPVRVCNGCFDVAYLVTYALDVDHGISTQIHGVRGLLELTEKDDEKDLHNMVAYGGVDALIWLCRTSKSIKLHHLTTTILAMLAEKESIRPVIITKWALPPLLYLIRYYTNAETILKKSPANSIRSTNTGSNQSDEMTVNETRQSIILEIIINCTHILYQLSRAGILSQKEVITEGVFDTLFMLASFEHISADVTKDEQQHINERLTIIQNLAAKAISAISSLVTFQASIIELIQNSKNLSGLLRSRNEEVRKYIAKTIAYLSLRNEKYKSNLLHGDGSRALVSILVVLPFKDDRSKQTRAKDLCYYLSRQVDVNEQVQKDDKTLNSATVSHACCALANFATNNESQANLMSQPRFLKYICNVPTVFPNHDEIHRHVARCLANLALYEENSKLMLANKKSTKEGEKDSFNVLPTLLFMGKSSSSVQRHVVRAVDNLSSNVSLEDSKGLFNDAYSYIRKILQGDDGNEKDVDTIKRAKSIIARERLESKQALQGIANTTPEVITIKEEQISTQEELCKEEKPISPKEEMTLVQEDVTVDQQKEEVNMQESIPLQKEYVFPQEESALPLEESVLLQEESILKQEEPELQHKEPELQQEEHELQQEEPVLQHKEPVLQQEEPELQKKEPKSQKKEPKLQKKESKIQQEEPILKQDDPKSQHEEPVLKQDDPVLEKKEPESQNKEHVSQPQEPNQPNTDVPTDPVIVSSSTEGEEVEGPKQTSPLPIKHKRKSKRNKKSD